MAISKIPFLCRRLISTEIIRFGDCYEDEGKTPYFILVTSLLGAYFPTGYLGHNSDTKVFKFRGSREETLVICTLW